jgi:hypothetical protein
MTLLRDEEIRSGSQVPAALISFAAVISVNSGTGWEAILNKAKPHSR